MQSLRHFRKSQKLSLEVLAEKLGISAGQLSRIERGEATSLKTALAIERLSGVKVGPLADASNRDLKAVARVLGERTA